MSKIAISVVVDLFADEGTTVRPKRVAELLRDSFDICFITRSSSDMEEIDGIPVQMVRPARTRLWNLKLFRTLYGNDYDYIYCSSDWFGFLTYYFLRRFYHYKIIFEAHTIISEEFKERKANPLKVFFFQVLEKFVVKRSDFLVTLSENIYEFYSYKKNIELVHVFIDEDLFIRDHDDDLSLSDHDLSNRDHIQESGDDYRVVGLIGPFDEFSNRYFLEFLEKNIDSFDDRIHFKIIGKCQERIDHPRMEYTGYIEDIRDYVKVLSSLDALIVPSRTATLGPLNKIVEAMACSVPVFTTPKGIVGLYNILEGQEIFVFSEDDLVSGLNDNIFGEELIKVAGNARGYVEKYYSKEANKQKLMGIFNRLNQEKY